MTVRRPATWAATPRASARTTGREDVRVLVTASRDWPDPDLIRRVLAEEYWATVGRRFVVVQGGAPGGDTVAAGWAAGMRQNGSVLVEAETHRIGSAGPLARDRTMVAEGADVAHAFVAPCTKPGPCYAANKRRLPDGHGSHGATYTALLALEAGMELHVWRVPTIGSASRPPG